MSTPLQIQKMRRISNKNRSQSKYHMPFAAMLPSVLVYGGLALVYLEGCKKNKDFDEIENDRPQGGGECDLQQMEHVLPGTQHQKYFIYQEPSHGKNGCHGNGMCMPHKYNAPVVHHQPQLKKKMANKIFGYLH